MSKIDYTIRKDGKLHMFSAESDFELLDVNFISVVVCNIWERYFIIGY